MSKPTQDQRRRHACSLLLEFEGSTWETLSEESAKNGLTVEEFITFSVLYYLADVDSGRIARRISRSPYPSVHG